MDRIVATKELAFRVGFSGHSGHLRVEPLPPVERPGPLHHLPDFIPVSVSSLCDTVFVRRSTCMYCIVWLPVIVLLNFDD